MLERLMFLASYGSADGAVNNMFEIWHQMGFFSYILPFLILFGLTFLALKSSPFLADKDKSKTLISAVISLAVGLIAVQVPAVSNFFAVIFPNLGIALAVLLVIIIGLGIFLPKEALTGKLQYLWVGIAGVIVVIVLASTAGTLGWSSIQWWQNNWATITAVVVIIGLVAAIVVGIVKSN